MAAAALRERSPIAWGDSLRGLRLGVAAERDVYGLADPVELVLILRNEGPQPVRLVETHLLWEYRFLVSRDGLEPVPMTDEAQKIERSLQAWHSGARYTIEIPPETTQEGDWKAPLHDWFEIRRSGRYAVQAQRNDWRDGDAVLTSGVAHFEVR